MINVERQCYVKIKNSPCECLEIVETSPLVGTNKDVEHRLDLHLLISVFVY